MTSQPKRTVGLVLIVLFLLLGCQQQSRSAVYVKAYGAPWCGQCQADARQFYRLERAGIPVVHYNVDEVACPYTRIPVYEVYRGSEQIYRTDSFADLCRYFGVPYP